MLKISEFHLFITRSVPVDKLRGIGATSSIDYSHEELIIIVYRASRYYQDLVNFTLKVQFFTQARMWYRL